MNSLEKSKTYFVVLNCSSFFKVDWESTVLNGESLFWPMLSVNGTHCFQILFSRKSRNYLSPTFSSSYKFCATVSWTTIFVSRSNRALPLFRKGLPTSSRTDGNFFTSLWKLFELIQTNLDARPRTPSISTYPFDFHVPLRFPRTLSISTYPFDFHLPLLFPPTPSIFAFISS